MVIEKTEPANDNTKLVHWQDLSFQHLVALVGLTLFKYVTGRISKQFTASIFLYGKGMPLSLPWHRLFSPER